MEEHKIHSWFKIIKTINKYLFWEQQEINHSSWIFQQKETQKTEKYFGKLLKKEWIWAD